ncbi:PREDICTED: uncharacterized protein LOC105362726 [Ceratosolen solmsi marchali]|uniref:Uncharacterized protein LOC105362726 n=1 Tax=Ceratosolen solmsi marchali TaxID=326594 RepID=A0AAJ6YI63_9HYME|nr:PREDICTED: uncharacterized protein LOC105362726 [Ceratosolen solmsi marchali]
MRSNAELIILSKIYCFIAVLVLISSFAGCAAGSCLSYGHSCWGAHGKRNDPESDPGNRRIGPSGLASRWLFFSRMVNRQAALSPRSRPRMMPEMSLLTEPRLR